MVCKSCQQALGAILITTIISFCFAKSFSPQPLSDTDLRLYLRSRDANSEFDFIRPVRKDINRSTRSTRNVDFHFSAFSEKFDLSLESALPKSFDAGLVVRTIGKDGKTKISSPKQGCYHTGFSRLHEGSSASVNLCDKFSGMIKTDKTHYDILPLTDEHMQKFKKSEDFGEIPSHIITRRATMNTENCDLNVRREVDTNRVNRRKRDLVDTRYVEISVVADDSIFSKYGNYTEQYVLSAFDEVAALFRDQSLDVDIRIHVSGLTILESPQENLKLVDELSRTITSFCEWQKEVKSDVSVLITGTDLKTGGTSTVTGKAVDVGGACNPLKKCIVTEDHGPSQLALALTHEIGHSIGMYHDDGFSECNDQHYIMSPKESASRFIQWSECSNKDLMEFLKSPDSHCLENKPETLPALDGLSVVLQGFYVNSTRQCQYLHGQNARTNPKLERTSEICSNLQCIVDGELLLTGSRALDGTQCGSHKRNMCLMGSCVEAYSTQVCADNPGGICEPEWIADDWGDCINCVETRLIFCVEFHDDNTIRLVTDLSRCPVVQPDTTRDCCTSSFQYDIGEYGDCTTTCGSGFQFRTVECRNGNNLVVEDSLCPGVKPTTQRQCVGLPACEVTNTYTVFAGALSDCSTTCGPGTRTRSVFCIRNSVQQVDPSDCVTAGVEVPASQVDCNLGACEAQTFIFIEGNFGECSVTCGTGQQSRVVVCVDESNSVVPTSNCTDSGLQEPVSTVACNLQACQVEVVFDFVAGDFPECPITCGTTTVTRSVTCENQVGVVVPDIVCTNMGLVRPTTEFECTFAACVTFEFVTGSFGACSTTCGAGVQVRTVECQNTETNDVVPDAACPGMKPAEFQACSGTPCPSQFQYISGPFGECNCEGVQTRLVICVEVNGIALSPVDDTVCEGLNITPLSTTQACTVPDTCSGPVWTTGEFSECSVTCGNGIQTRLVYCVANPGSTDIVSDDDCVADDRPSSFQPCTTQVACPPEYLWLATEFSACSVTCGEGIRQRTVLCYSIGLSGGFVFADPANCVPADEPTTVEACTEDPCSGVFIATPWSECSVTCGQGEETRTVTCSQTKASLDPLPLTECDDSVPPDTRVCYEAPCPPDYGCDVSYDASTSITFTISSPNYPNNYPDDLYCLRVIRAPAGNHVEITFTDFVMEPGCTFDTLTLTDVEYNNTVTLFCDESSLVELPYTYASVGTVVDVLQQSDVSVSRRGFTGSFQAVTNDVYRYVPGNWSECDVTCGEGIQTRSLTCLLNDAEVSLLDCSGLETPATLRSCFRDDCPTPDECDVDVLRTEAGTIRSPRFPSQYPSNTTCSNLIVAPEGQVVQISVAFLSIEDSPECQKDVLLVADSEEIGLPLAFCGDYDPQVIFTSLTNQVRVTFISDDSVESTGYTITFIFVTPSATECGSVVEAPGQVIASPGYPEGYNNSEDCIIGIQNADGCVELVFTDIDIASDRDCEGDYVMVEDLINVQVVRRMCGSVIPPPFVSASGSVRISFISDGNVTGRGYTAVPRFVDCPTNVQVPGEWSGCSVTCGVGVEVREIICIDVVSGVEVANELCEDLPELPSERRCDLGECPSCDLLIDVAQSGVVQFPPVNPTYSNNQDCRITITNPGGCVTIVFVSIDLQPGSEDGLCDTDYIEMTDSSNPLVSLRLCGDPKPYPLFNSISSTMTIDFHSDEAVVSGGFSFYPNFNDCPAFAFIPGPYSPCSVTCGGGIRTRSVFCRNLVTNTAVTDVLCGTSVYPTEEPCGLEPCATCSRNYTESGLIVSPNNDLGYYPNNTYCEYYISNPNQDGCVSLSFLEFQLEEVDDNGLCNDFLTLIDLGFPAGTFSFCQNLTNLIISRSSDLFLSFTSDESGVARGYQIFVNLVVCPDFAYDVTELGECSVSCGNDGVMSRSVQCINVQTLQPADDNLCPNIRPRDTFPCGPQPECIPCDLELTSSRQFIDSFNYPGNYDNNQQCTYTITNPDGCVRVSILIFSLDEGDSLEISDDGYSLIGITLTGERTFTSWLSRTGSVTLTFRADDEDNDGNFRLYENFVPCPVFGYVAGEFSECSTTCGPGVRTRSVECVNLQAMTEAEDSLCSDPLPEAEEQCFLEACPSCDRYITDLDTDVTIQSPGYPELYEANTECAYVLNSTMGMCINVFIISMDTEGPNPGNLGEGDECFGYDVLNVVDNEFPYRSTAYCGQSGVSVEPIATYGSVGTVVFSTNNNSAVGVGFTGFVAFVPCTVEYAYFVGEFGECDATCGEAARYRSVECIEIASGDVVDTSFCEEEAPEMAAECEDIPDCPSCDAFFNSTVNTVENPDAPNDYPSRTSCVYTLSNPEDGCVRIAFTEFDLFETADSCEDYLEISEPAYPFNDPVRLCPLENSVPGVFRSFSPQVEVLFVSSLESEGGNFKFFGLQEDCPTFGYVAGPFSECPITCGDVSQVREVQCVELDSGDVVSDASCSGVKPPTMRECDLPECPSCDGLIQEPDELIQSPGYDSGGYGPLTSCLKVILNNEGCVNLFFANIDLEARNETTGECMDYIEVSDSNAPTLTEKFCGNELEGTEWLSRFGGVSIKFESDLNGVEGQGFNIFPTFVECPVYGYQILSIGECSTTCGVGERTRTIACVQLSDMTAVSDSQCSDRRPSSTEPCVLMPCPVCDRVIESTLLQVTTENYPMEYPLNQQCDFDFVSPDTRCWTLYFSVLDFPEPDPVTGCDEDYVLLTEVGPYGRSERYCGYRETFFINSRYPNMRLSLVTDGVSTGDTGFEMAASSLGMCPTVGFVAGEYGNCSKVCGGGVRSRIISCVNFISTLDVPESQCSGEDRPTETEACNLEPCPSCDQYFNTTNSVIRSPNYPLMYEPNQVCSYRLYNPSDCIRITFEDMDLQGANVDGICDTDYLQITDVSDTGALNGDLSEVYCGTLDFDPWVSRTGDVTVVLSTDSSEERSGFSLRMDFIPCPTIGYVYTQWSDCSVTCGSGLQSRVVLCQNLETNVLAENCPGVPQETMRVCTLGPCPSCDLSISSSPATIVSPNYPMMYPNSASCEYKIYNPDGCVQAVFANLDLQSDGDSCVDSILFADDFSPGINTEYCGSPAPLPPSWQSLSGNVTFTFNSDPIISGNGFSVTVAFVECATYGFVIEDIGVCSVTCGGGVQNRTVSCKRMDTMDVVDDDYCVDTKPATIVACNDEECPIECDDVILNVIPGENMLQSPGFGFVQYENNINCQNTIINFNGCMQLSLTSISIQPGDTPLDCNRDYVQFRDTSFTSITERYCGYTVPTYQWRSGGSVTQVTLVTDGSVRDVGYNLVYNFIDRANCPQFEFVMTTFSECSTTCGDGIQVRQSRCQNGLGQQVSSSQCRGARPEEVRACFPANEPCPSFQYETGNWSVCSETCGLGQQSRSVVCVDVNSNPVNETLCDDVIPDTIRNCSVMACPPPVYVYETGNYSECQATCGDSVRTRNVTCVDEDGNVVTDDLCSGMPPLSVTPCNEGPCYEYATGNYSDCSVTCGLGTETRPVTCRNVGSLVEVNATFCSDLNAPLATRSCFVQVCPVFNYMATDWSDCSVTCGNGTRSRTISCEDQFGNIGNLSDCTPPSPPSEEACATGIECVSETATCGSSVSAVVGGNFSSPNFPSQYENNLNCIITFQVSANSLLRLTFSTLDLDFGTGLCERDSIRITGRQQDGSEMFVNVCAALSLPFEWTSNPFDTSVTLAFTTDASITATGFFGVYDEISLAG